MAFDQDSLVYRQYDLVRRVDTLAEYKITEIQQISPKYGYTPIKHYRLQNTSTGCLDSPFWITCYLMWSLYEPCNPAIKILFDRGSKATNPP